MKTLTNMTIHMTAKLITRKRYNTRDKYTHPHTINNTRVPVNFAQAYSTKTILFSLYIIFFYNGKRDQKE